MTEITRKRVVNVLKAIIEELPLAQDRSFLDFYGNKIQTKVVTLNLSQTAIDSIQAIIKELTED
ncbi:hypothetical protein [Filifactor alocis]|uniref:hypothetical protein n=1 Tax=Filifactor alocis TaxID=143361 RepID=UPI0023522489